MKNYCTTAIVYAYAMFLHIRDAVLRHVRVHRRWEQTNNDVAFCYHADERVGVVRHVDLIDLLGKLPPPPHLNRNGVVEAEAAELRLL